MVEEEFFEEAVMSDSEDSEEEDEEDTLVDADEMSAGEAGFIHGYKEADKVADRKTESEEEELE